MSEGLPLKFPCSLELRKAGVGRSVTYCSLEAPHFTWGMMLSLEHPSLCPWYPYQVHRLSIIEGPHKVADDHLGPKPSRMVSDKGPSPTQGVLSRTSATRFSIGFQEATVLATQDSFTTEVAATPPGGVIWSRSTRKFAEASLSVAWYGPAYAAGSDENWRSSSLPVSLAIACVRI